MRRTALLLVLLLPLTLVACKKTVQVGDDKDVVGKEAYRMVMPKNGKIDDPVHGKEMWFAVGPVSGVEGTPANGVTMAQMFEDGTYVHSMQINIAVPAKGQFYEAWLLSDKDEQVSLGHLQNYFGDVRHQLKFQDKKDLTGYKKVVVTLETDAKRGEGKKVAEAELIERQR